MTCVISAKLKKNSSEMISFLHRSGFEIWVKTHNDLIFLDNISIKEPVIDCIYYKCIYNNKHLPSQSVFKKLLEEKKKSVIEFHLSIE